MPLHKELESLQQQCFKVLASIVHQIAVELEEDVGENSLSKSRLSEIISGLPSSVIEHMLTKVIESIHLIVNRTRRVIGLQTCLEILMQPSIFSLDISGLFFNMRLPSAVNMTIRRVVNSRIQSLTNLTHFNMVSNCDDNILTTIGTYCLNMQEIILSISNLVTDNGIINLTKGCQKLQKLGIYKCWEVTATSVKYVLTHSKQMREIQCDQLGAVLLKYFYGSNHTFKLETFEQTQSVFEPCKEEMQWLEKSCPFVTSVRLYIDDEHLLLIPFLSRLRILELEMVVLGAAFLHCIINFSSSLTTLQINCESLEAEHLLLIGKQCTQLTTLHLTTATIEGDDQLVNDGHHFSHLENLNLQVYKEAMLKVECIEYFMKYCFRLVSVILKAEMEFFTDSFLRNLLIINPLASVTKLIIASDKYVPLTVSSVEGILSSCPVLEHLSVSSWDVSEEEFMQLTREIKKNNFNLAIT